MANKWITVEYKNLVELIDIKPGPYSKGVEESEINNLAKLRLLKFFFLNETFTISKQKV